MRDNSKVNTADRRTILKYGTALAAITGTAGCMGDEDADDIDDSDDVAAETEEGEIELWHGLEGGQSEFLEDLVAEFDQNHDEGAVEAVRQGDQYDHLAATMGAIRGGSGPEISHFTTGQTRTVFETEQFQPVGEIIDEHTDFDWDQLTDGSRNVQEFDGDQYGFPFQGEVCPMLAYNKDLFEEAGLDPEDPPFLFDEVYDACEALIENTDARFGISMPLDTWILRNSMALHDQLFINEENGYTGTPTEIHLTSDASLRWHEFQDELATQEYSMPAGHRDWGESMQALFSGVVGMSIVPSSMVADLTEGAEQGGWEPGMSMFPHSEEDWTGFIGGSHALWTPEGDYSEEEERMIAELLTFLVQPENNAEFHRQSGSAPVNQESAEVLREEGWFDENPLYEPGVEAIFESEGTPATNPPLYQAKEEVDERIIDIDEELGADRERPIEDILQDAKDDVDELLQDAA